MQQTHPPQQSDSVDPMVIDLDGTLLQTDLLVESLIYYLKKNLFNLFRVLGWLLRGRSYLKRQLAMAFDLDVSLLPCNQDLLAYVQSEKECGRKIYLATAADQILAEKIADRCGFFDGVLASDGKLNLKGAAKAKLLKDMFPQGFIYAGNSAADLPVWRQATAAVLVNTSKSTQRRAREAGKMIRNFPRPPQWPALVRSARLHQWAKNGLIFIPLILSGQLVYSQAVLATVLSFIAMGFVASSSYFINDLWDLSDDRQHWSKKLRPLASGALSLHTAGVFIAAALTLGFAIAAIVGEGVFTAIALYLAVSLSYSFALKRAPLIDSFVLASLFSLRLIIGIVASGATPSAWLIVFSMFFFSSLSLAKRYVEIQRVKGTANLELAGRGYRVTDAPLVLGAGLATGIGAVLIMVLYLIEDAFQQTFYGNVSWLWGFPIILQLFVYRIWLVCQRGEMDDDPVLFALRDGASLALFAAATVCFFMAWLS